jgi:hypothetical protein
MYKWGYLVSSILAKLDLDEDEAATIGWINKFTYFANEAMTQICSTIKPKREYFIVKTYSNVSETEEGVIIDGVHYKGYSLLGSNIVNENGEVEFYKVGTLIKIKDANFISFSDDICTLETIIRGNTFTYEVSDEDLIYKGINSFICTKIGIYTISYNAKWYKFWDGISDDEDIDVPDDILDCIPSYVASQCYKVDDEYKSSVYRNEYEMFLARIDDTDFKNTSTFKIGGDW